MTAFALGTSVTSAGSSSAGLSEGNKVRVGILVPGVCRRFLRIL